MKWSTVHIDGHLYFWNAVGSSALTYLSSEEAYHYINPVWLFWIKLAIGSGMAGCNGLKAFRSMTFGRFAQQEQAKETKTP